jgi:RNA polymerase sigma factor (sigma-70 family)
MTKTDYTGDTELLETFINQRDESAFAVLVQRHQGTVMGACRRILGNTQDAEDAFQAVFLALAREASKLTRHPAIGAWLHRVACGTAIDACRRRTTREAKEREASAMQEEIVAPSQVTEEAGALLHAELNALPERYRRPLILFHIEGLSLEETCRRLNVPVNTVSTWLRRGREKLRTRLLRKGVLFSVAGLGAALSAESAAAGVADALAISTAKAAAAMAGGGLVPGGAGAVSANVAGMLKGTLKMIFMAKVKAVCLIGAGVILAGSTTAVLAQKVADSARPSGNKAVEPASAAISPAVAGVDPSEAFMARFDTNKDDRLSFYELDAAAAALKSEGGKFQGRFLPHNYVWLSRKDRDAAVAAFAAWDTDGNGDLSVSELNAHNVANGHLMFDENKDGKVTVEEVCVSPASKSFWWISSRFQQTPDAEIEKQRRRMERFDADRDGSLSSNELAAAQSAEIEAAKRVSGK